MAVASLVRLDWEVQRGSTIAGEAEVIATDGPFGNLVTDVDADDFLKLTCRPGRYSISPLRRSSSIVCAAL